MVAEKTPAEAGYPDGIEFTLYSSPNEVYQQIAIMLQSQLAPAGFTVNIVTEDGGTITISGGTVYAYGNRDSDTCGAGIGGGQDASGGNITISGGYVRAYGGNNAAGIGSGEETTTGPNINGGTITITGGDVSGIGQDGGAGIGAGAGASAGYISITGGIVEGHGGNDSSAICSHDTEHDPNIVYVGDYMRVHAGSNFFAAADRLYYFWNARDVHAEPCTHNGNPCTWCMYRH